MMSNEFADGRLRNIEIQGSCRMVLDPLAEIVLGVLVAIGIGCRQFMVNVLRDSEGGESEKQTDEPQCHSGPEQVAGAMGGYVQSQHDGG